MTLKEDVANQINIIFDTNYDIATGTVVPSLDSLTFGATAKEVWMQVLYIDMRGSKKLLDSHKQLSVLKAHKAFLYSIVKTIRFESGHPRSFNGDSVLAFWPIENPISISGAKAVRSAMKIKWLIQEIINPKMQQKYGETLDFGIGVSQGTILVGKSGIGGDSNFQDLIWLGYGTYEAHCFGETARNPNNIWISEGVWDDIKNNNEMVYSSGTNMWTKCSEKLSIGYTTFYKTSYRWIVN